MSGAHGLAARLGKAAAAGSSGVITATQGKLKRLFCLDQGWLAHAASNVVEEQFAETLVGGRLIDAGTRLSAEQHSVMEGKKLSGYLVDHGAVSLARMQVLVETHVRRLLASTLGWSQGEFRFAEGRPKLDGEVTVKLSPAALILEHVQQHPASLDEVRVRVGPPNLRPMLDHGREKLLDALDLGSAVPYLLEHCDGRAKLHELMSGSPAPPGPTLRTLYGLLLLGVLIPAAEGEVQETVAGELVTLDELMARLKRAKGADCYTVLEMHTGAAREQIRQAYYFLARRYHPDRFRSGALANLLPEIEGYFTQVTEAYNTLYDPILRADYDRKREDTSQTTKPEPEQDRAYLAKQNFARAKLLIGKGRYSDAVVFLENAVELDAAQASYHLELGRVLLRSPRRRDDARRHLLQATRLEPSHTGGYLALGQLYRKTGQDMDAADMFREVLRWEPDHEEATRELEELAQGPADEGGRRRGLFKG